MTYTMDDFKITRESTVELIDRAGDDVRIVCAARTSTSSDIRKEMEDRHGDDKKKEHAGLINYLMKHRHGSPFEQSWLQFYIRAPIFVWREFHRHRIGWSYNEESGRYKQLAPEFYLPPAYRPMFKVEGWKPGRPKFLDLNDDDVEDGFTKYEQHCEIQEAAYRKSYETYLQSLSLGLDPGLARACLGVGVFSTCVVACNPRSLMHFLSLRTHHEDAKFVSYPLYEIERVAEKIERSFSMEFPITYNAFVANGRVAP